MAIVILIIIWIVVMVLAFVVPVSYVLAKYVSSPTPKSFDAIRKTEGDVLDEYDQAEREPFTVTNGGYTLHGEVIYPESAEYSSNGETDWHDDGVYLNSAEQSTDRNMDRKGNTDKVVILTHAYTGNRLQSVRYMHFYRKMGFTCVIYDSRGCGENTKAPSTMGAKETGDLLAVIGWAKLHFGGTTNPKKVILGLHGISLGASTSIMALKEHPDVDFVVSDSGFADFMPVLTALIKKQFRMPAFLVKTASMANKLFYKYSFQEIRPIDSLSGNQIPVCFFHGEGDTVVPKADSAAMAEKTEGASSVYIFKGVNHIQLAQKAPEQYERDLREFLIGCGITVEK